VLSSLTLGQYVPMLSGKPAFLAHWAETVHFYDKQAMVSRFFRGDTSQQERLQTLRDFNVVYVVCGPAEEALGNYAPDSAPFLAPVFVTPLVTVYKVNLDP